MQPRNVNNKQQTTKHKTMNRNLKLVTTVGVVIMVFQAARVTMGLCSEVAAWTHATGCPTCIKQECHKLSPLTGDYEQFEALCVKSGGLTDRCYAYDKPVNFRYREYTGSCMSGVCVYETPSESPRDEPVKLNGVCTTGS